MGLGLPVVICFLLIALNEVVEVVASPVLHFLFLEDKHFKNAHIWSHFFHGNTSHTNTFDGHLSDEKYKVYVLGLSERFVPPAHMPIHHVVMKDGDAKKHSSLSAMLYLLQESMKDTKEHSSDDDEDMFVFLSSDSLPLKSLKEIYNWFYHDTKAAAGGGGGGGGGGRTASEMCVSPWSEWKSNDINPFIRAVKHNPWVMLNRTDAAKLDISSYIEQENVGKQMNKSFYNYSTLHIHDQSHMTMETESNQMTNLNLNPNQARHSHESDTGHIGFHESYWFYLNLYGEIGNPNPNPNPNPNDPNKPNKHNNPNNPNNPNPSPNPNSNRNRLKRTEDMEGLRSVRRLRARLGP